MSEVKSYKELLEQYVPDHPNKNKLLDALETRMLVLEQSENDIYSKTENFGREAVEIFKSLIRDGNKTDLKETMSRQLDVLKNAYEPLIKKAQIEWEWVTETNKKGDRLLEGIFSDQLHVRVTWLLNDGSLDTPLCRYNVVVR